MKYTLRSSDGKTYYTACVKDGSLQLENTHHYEGAPGSPWIDAFYSIKAAEFPHILELFGIPQGTEIIEALKVISNSDRVQEFDRLLGVKNGIIAENSSYWSFDD